MKLSICNQTCHLLTEKGVYWEEQKTLILADIHIGKGTVFQKAGIPIPQAILDDDLMNMTRLLKSLHVEKCIIVGDLIHAQNGISDEVKKKFSQWLHNATCSVHLVLGNHDRPLIKNLPQEWPLSVHQDGLLIEPFYFSHYPQPHPPWFVWAGHLHPKVKISNTYDRLVLRCFQIFSDLAIIPAFGFFVGGTLVRKSEKCRIYAITEDTVIEI